MARPRGKRVPGLRARLTAVVGIYSVATLLVAALLLWMGSVLEGAVQVLVRDTSSMSLASEANLELLAYQRLANLYLITGEPTVAAERERVLRRLTVLIRESERFVGEAEEGDLVRRAGEGVEAYVGRRRAAEAMTDDPEEAVRLSRGALNAALEALHALRRSNAVEVEAANRAAARAARLATQAALVAAAGALAGLTLVVLGLSRWLVRPVQALQEVIHRYRRGEWEAEAPPAGPREIREIAAAFNDMREDLTRQRQNQLAFVAGVAHDLRTPMAAMKLGVQRLKRQMDRAREIRTDDLERLDRQFDRLDNLVGDLMDAARIEAGRLELVPARFDLREVVRDVVELYRPVSLRHHLGLHAPAEPVTVRADRARIEQVIVNLVSNAIKYSPAGGEVRVGVYRRGDEAGVEVTDEGVGIPQAELDDLFRPFHRRTATRHVGPGAGLGLAIVDRLARAHGGRIEVESEPAFGSTFRLVLPLAVDPTRP